MSEHRVIGGSSRRVDVADKVTGRALYADDLVLPRMLHCKLLRSRVPHAELLRVDVSAALEIPGVLAAITGADLPIPYGILPVSQDEHALCRDRVRFVGDPIAAVAAEDEETATAALARIAVELRPLDPVGSIEDALARTWLAMLAGDVSPVRALLRRRIRLHGSPRLLRAFARCFPS